MDKEKNVFKIDIDKVLASKMGSKARWVPGFLRSYLKRIVHQEEINEFCEKVGDTQGVPWLDAVVEYLDIKLNVHGLENLPSDADGRSFTFVSNHPLGGPDGIAIGQILGHHYELDDFRIQSVTEGHEAVGSGIIKLRSGGRLYSGKGVSTDIIGASINAYINALNKICFEEDM